MVDKNLDPDTVSGFGEEWSRFDQSGLESKEHKILFERYFAIFPFAKLPDQAEGFDFGAGSGRWAKMIAPRVGMLHVLDASERALGVAKKNLRGFSNCHFAKAEPTTIPLRESSQDFGYSLGVLHHIPDTTSALKSCVQKLKPGAPFLLYVYYRFDNRPIWFRGLWWLSHLFRAVISRLPFFLRARTCDVIALLIYFPFSRLAKALEILNCLPKNFPLSSYRNLSLYSLRTDALDRFGTRLEQRFTRAEIQTMMTSAGLVDIQFREAEPYWVAVGVKA